MKRNALLLIICIHCLILPVKVFAQVNDAKEDDMSNKLKTIDSLIADAHEGISYISNDAYKTRVKANKKLVLLDVRTAEEYQAGHLKGAAWVERGVAEFLMVRTLPDPDAEIVIYCKVGHRASLVAKALRKAGYNNIRVLKGGFDAWVEAGNSVYNYLGELKVINIIKRNASSLAVDFYESKE